MNLKPALSTEAQVDQLMAFIWSFLFTCYHSDLNNNNNNKKRCSSGVSSSWKAGTSSPLA